MVTGESMAVAQCWPLRRSIGFCFTEQPSEKKGLWWPVIDSANDVTGKPCVKCKGLDGKPRLTRRGVKVSRPEPCSTIDRWRLDGWDWLLSSLPAQTSSPENFGS